MKILLLAHGAFFHDLPEKYDEKRKWIDSFVGQLKAAGHEVAFFDPQNTNVRDFDVSHVFANEAAELWFSLRKYGVPVVVTPSLSPWSKAQKTFSARLIESLSLAGRAVTQLRWPPVDSRYFFSKANAYLVLSTDWKVHLSSEWKVTASKIHVFSADATQAANEAQKVYEEARRCE
jgi:hypothetical protein